MNKGFWIDRQRNMYKSYNDFIKDINSKNSVSKYIYAQNPYQVFVDIIYNAINNYDVVLLGKNKKVTHCGLYYNNGVLHSLKNMVIWQPMAQITDTYGLIEYYRHDRND